MSKRQLLNECLPKAPIQILESQVVDLGGGRKTRRFRSVLQNFEDVNLNNRLYPKKIWEKQLAEDSDFAVRMRERLTLGHIEHPDDGVTRLPQVAIVVTEARFATDKDIAESNGKVKSSDIIGTIELLPTPQGQLLAALTEANIPWGLSSRGNGSIEESGSHDIVSEDYVLETWDAVFSPSVARAIPSLMTESRARMTERVALLETKWECDSASMPPKEKGAATGGGEESEEEKEKKKKLPDFLRDKGESTTPPAPEPRRANPPTNQPTESTKMSKLAEIRKLRLNLSEVSQRNFKNLRASDKALLFESLDSIRHQAAGYVQEDPTVAYIAEDINKIASSLASKLDEEFPGDEAPAGPSAGGPPAPPAGGPPAPPAGGPPAPAPDAPPAPGEGGDEAEVLNTLQRASDLLRELGGEDPEAAEVADGLDGLADRVADIDMEDPALPGDEIENLPMESRRLVSRYIAPYQRRHKQMQEQLGRMSTAAKALLEKHRKGQKFEGSTIQEWATAAKEIVTKYHTESCATACALLQLKEPTLFEAHKTELVGFKNYKKLLAFVEGKKKGPSPVPGAAPAAPPVTESTTAPAGAAPASKQKTPAPAVPLAEDVHPQIALARRQRTYGK